MVKEQDYDEERVLQMLKSHVSGVTFKRSHGKEVAYIIPHSEVSKFPKLFKSLEESKDNKTIAQSLGISSYGVSMPTLEEVFLKLEEDTEENNKTIEGSQNPSFYSSVLPLDVQEPTNVDGDSTLLDPSKITPNMQKDSGLIKLHILGSDEDPISPDHPQQSFIIVSDTFADNATSKRFETTLNSTFMVDSFLSGKVNILDVAPHFLGVNILATDSGTDSILSYTALYNDTAIHSLPAVINSVSSAILKMRDPKKQIITYSFPWPCGNKLKWDGSSFSSALMIGLAFVLVAPGFAVTIVYETQNKIRSQLRVSGVTFNMYWGTVFIFSLLIYLIPAVACLIIALATKLPSFTPAGAILSVIFLFIVFIPNALLLAFVFSFFFNKFETCMAVLPNIFTMAGMIPYMIVSLLDMLSTQNTATVLHYIFLFTDPLYTIFGGFYYIDKFYAYSLFQVEDVPTLFLFYCLCALLCFQPLLEFPLLYLLLRILDVRRNGGTVQEALPFGFSQSMRIIPPENTDKIENEDEDVANERQLVERLYESEEGRENCAAFVRQIRKEFIKQEESMPCKKSKQEQMKIAVVVAGHDVHSNLSEAFQALGYCPQHDAQWDTIRLEEHLECYAAIKGIAKKDIPLVVDYFVKNLKADDHRKKNSKELSGGTKRKLSYAMSMLGWPEIVLLDEPSTGMDPKSKRFLWCLGPTQHLKSKYGSGYLLEVKLGIGQSAASALEDRLLTLQSHLQSLFPSAVCLESFGEHAQYRIPQEEVHVLSSAFEAFENCE
ncbi:hypothetical protein C0Q70_00974 [Pomacea canaliculata]|uniref:ABC transporter domain-containing protein n=1 Tax=Pomacea canaliculata TaxID=400727 RepID=A0A2T7PY84_POMCA|nr:hypothetical protein C0Q70_00974 [Pomacea canaliculata]